MKNNARYLYDDMTCRACMDPHAEESVIHFSQTCPTFQEERRNEILQVEDIFGTLHKQIAFIKTFKIINRKWKLILDMS